MVRLNGEYYPEILYCRRGHKNTAGAAHVTEAAQIADLVAPTAKENSWICMWIDGLPTVQVFLMISGKTTTPYVLWIYGIVNENPCVKETVCSSKAKVLITKMCPKNVS